MIETEHWVYQESVCLRGRPLSLNSRHCGETLTDCNGTERTSVPRCPMPIRSLIYFTESGETGAVQSPSDAGLR